VNKVVDKKKNGAEEEERHVGSLPLPPRLKKAKKNNAHTINNKCN
jgi:hypothetical protein